MLIRDKKRKKMGKSCVLLVKNAYLCKLIIILGLSWKIRI
jgi:hypothetical protein